MFGKAKGQEVGPQVARPERVREVSNDLYIFEYKSSRSKSKKSKWDLTDTKCEKSAAYLLKKDELREKRTQAQQPSNELDHRSNIDRLYSLISRSRTFIKTNDSGCEKMIRAISRLIDKSSLIDMRDALKLGIEALKKYTMTCSSSNYELFIQSKHNLKDTIKVKTTETKLQEISQNAEENTLMGQPSRNYRQMENIENSREMSISFQNMEKPPLFKPTSRGNITTQEELSFDCEFSPIKGHSIEVSIASVAPKIYPSIAKTRVTCIQLEPLQRRFQQKTQMPSQPCSEIQKNSCSETEAEENQRESDEIGLIFSQVTFLFTSQSQDKSSSKASGKCPSPIYNLLYALPTSFTNASATPLPNPNAKVQNQPNRANEANKSTNQSKLFKKESKKEKILTANEYAEKMLFGQGEKQVQQVKQRTIRNPLMQENNRKRVSSLPKITFTYTSREKYEQEASPEMKQSTFPITIYNYKKREITIKDSSCKNTSKGEIQTNFSSKPAITNRNNPRLVTQASPQNQYNTPGVIRNPIRHHKIAVSPRQPQFSIKSSFNQQAVPSEYYGDPHQNLKKFDMMSQAMQVRRERVLTAQPGWQNDVQFVSVERQLPMCCWQGKETRSRSLNDRVLLANRYQGPLQV